MKKIPIVKQRDLKDCGPCCLLSIIKYYKGNIPLENIRNDCYTNIQGTTAYHLVNALKKYGFDAYGYKINNNNLNSRDLILPVVAHVELKNGYNHYVVIYKISNKTITIMDPAKGITKMEYKNFLEIFSGIIITCYPNGEVINYESINMFDFILKLVNENRELFIKIFLSGFLIVLFTILSGLYFKIGFNNIDNKSLLKTFVLIFFVVTTSKIVFEYLSMYFKNYLIKNIDYKLNFDFFNKFFYLPSKVVKNRTSGEIVTRVAELNNLHQIITDIIVSTIINIFLAITSFIVLYFISAKLLMILIIFTSLFFIVCIFSNKIIYRIIKENIESNEKFNSQVLEYCNAFESIKNNNIEKYSINKTQESLLSFLQSNFKINKILNVINTLKNTLIDFMHYTILTIGFYLLLKNKISLLNFITFESIFVYLIEPIKEILNNIPKLNYLKASLEKVLEFMSLSTENQDKKENFINGDIFIENLDFSYNDYNKTLNNINLKIKKNSHVMIKGNSGIGKSTLGKLLNRTYEYEKGLIKINNIDIRDYSLKTIRNNILYLSQNEFLFDDTIKNNIILDYDFDVNKFNEICKICHLEEVVKNKPLRYETFVNKDFANLSGGEKQRIILARALYRNFEIIILDEALSEVNYNLEIDIINHLHTFLSNKTLIYITHKSHDKYFDQVLTVGGLNAKL